ncbi:O-antigen ligase [Caulobacter sp. UNC279MFTsu5.1]|uniref:O-antigen ligase family protein n=1 Tax=Caulobacter sp. UNC279MFTsu5.1 TaxID=1502775 RepID=UPI0008EB39AA|nr:O-antigen ligase family protein [Caulobacter sp. UNC279MFTsu5.1]SFK63359.1 O-antigen ligase [Caulobacter sp. UNC279MFTsu5.1]
MTATSSIEPTEAPARRTPWLSGVAMFLAVMTPLLAYLAPLGFAPLLALAGLLALPGLRLTRAAAPPLLILVVLALWAAVSMSWSPETIDVSKLKDYGDIESLTALKLFLQLATYGAAVVALRGLSDAGARRAAAVLAYGMAALAAVAALDSLTGAAVYQKLHLATGQAIRPDLAMVKVSLSTYVLALLFWPAALILSRLSRPGLIWLLAAGIVVTSVICSSDACLLALAAGGLVWLLVYGFGQTAAKVLIGLVAAPFVLAPLAVLVGVQTGVVAWLHRLVPASWDARLNIWTFAADHVQIHPFRGWGLDASRTFGPAIPLHTHNAQLQLWLELGAIGAALAGVFFCWLAYGVVRLSRESRTEAAMAAAALVAYLVIGGLSFGVWQEWWLGLGALTLIACGLARAVDEPQWIALDELAPVS